MRYALGTLTTAALHAAALAAATACTSGPPPPDEGPYLAKSRQDRATNDAFFKSTDGPLLPEKRATVLELPQSHTAEKRKVKRIGVLHFSLPSAGPGELTLTAFVEVDSPDMNRLFVPFTDATSNSETYGGGRYLELTRTPTGLYDLDFNRAYHPYCLFNPSFECPVPPRENRMVTAIRAGEKLS